MGLIEEITAPKRLQVSAQGFNPGNPQNKRFGPEEARDYQANPAPIAASKSECAIETAAIGSYFNVADMFDVPPLQGASLMVRSQG